jgi:hypothetical protein
MVEDATDLFFDARLKIKRAHKHIGDMNLALLALEQNYTSAIERDPSTGIQQVTHFSSDLQSQIQELSLIVGDIIHNLRAALDFAWHSTVERHYIHKSSRSRRKFPVCDSRKKLEDALHGIEIDTLHPDLFNLLMSEIQPYKGGKNGVVYTLNELDVSDKHLLLLDLTPWGMIRDIVIRDKDGNISKGRGMPAPAIGRHTISFERNITIEDKGKVSVTVTLKESDIFHGVPISSLLPSFSKYVLYIVNLLENL